VTTASEKAVITALEIDPPDKLKAARQLVQTVDSAWPGVTSGKEAWETIAPSEWTQHAHRRFERGGEAPASVGDAVAIASDPEGIVAAEALAKQFLSLASRALKLDASPPLVCWRVTEPKKFRARFCSRSATYTGDSLYRALSTSATAVTERARFSMQPDLATALQTLQVTVARQWGPVAWDICALLKWHEMSGALGIESPFDALIALWESGYALDDVEPERIVLVAPPA
jgi:hypothetical protein